MLSFADKLINGGRFSDVYVGHFQNKCVAIKTFSASTQRQYYVNERTIYTLPFMEHDSILKFYGTNEDLTSSGETRYMLVFEYMTMGTLTQYLKLHDFPWMVLCRLCQSLAAGLAHLHREFECSGKCSRVLFFARYSVFYVHHPQCTNVRSSLE